MFFNRLYYIDEPQTRLCANTNLRKKQMFRIFIRNVSSSAVCLNCHVFGKDACSSVGIAKNWFQAILNSYRLIYRKFHQNIVHSIYADRQENANRKEIGILSGALCRDQEFSETRGFSARKHWGDTANNSPKTSSIQSCFFETNTSFFYCFCKTLFHCLNRNTSYNPYINRTGQSRTVKIGANEYSIDPMKPIKTSCTLVIDQCNRIINPQKGALSLGGLRAIRISNKVKFFANPFFIYQIILL